MKERVNEVWVLASPTGRKFLAKDFDGYYFVEHRLHEAVFFPHDPTFLTYDVRGRRRKRYPVSYYCAKPSTKEQRELGRFMQTAIGRRVTITMHATKRKG
jgi:hypothetical protein